MIEEATEKVAGGNDLSRAEARQVFDEIMKGEAATEQIKALLVALRDKGESVDEIAGAAESMRAASAAVRPKVKAELLDVVGTGGDGSKSFNISTASAFVAAGAGCIVAKHGNRSVSSCCGAADVLEAAGVNINTTSEKNAGLIEKIGIAFLFAPVHHPAMKHAMPARKEIGTRTIFNILGPITNPANAQTYLLGAFSRELAEKLANVLAELGAKHALVVHGASGCDEISLCSTTFVFEVAKGKVLSYEISPEQFGFKRCTEKELVAETVEESVKIFEGILSGKEKGCKRDAVLLNAGAAIYANNKAKSIAEGIKLAKESIDSGKALEKLEKLKEASKNVS